MGGDALMFRCFDASMFLLYESSAVAVLELLAAAAWTGVVAAGQFVFDDWRARLLGTGVLGSCCGLIGVSHLLLAQVLL
jgi:hypothetical protein